MNKLPTEMWGQDLSEFVDAWKTYENDELGFTFEYPLIYDEVGFCEVIEQPTEHGGIAIQVGSRIQVIVEPIGDSTIDEYINYLTDDMDNVEIISTPIAGREGFYVEYRYGGMGRLQEIYTVDVDSLRATFGLTGPWFCDFYQVSIWEPIAFEHILQTFAPIK